MGPPLEIPALPAPYFKQFHDGILEMFPYIPSFIVLHVSLTFPQPLERIL